MVNVICALMFILLGTLITMVCYIASVDEKIDKLKKALNDSKVIQKRKR